MSKQKTISRKSTFNSSKPDVMSPRQSDNKPNKRFFPMRALSFQDLSFSQHIYHSIPTNQPSITRFADSIDKRENFDTQRLDLNQKIQCRIENVKSKNPFFRAIVEVATRGSQKQIQEMGKKGNKEIDEMQSQLTTFKLIKKNSKKQTSPRAIDNLI